MKHLLHGVALAVLTTTLAQAASAQDAPATPAPPETQVAAADQPAAQPAEPSVPDIIVTATRRETNLQRTPLAISVVNPQALADRHVQSLYDFADGAVPSLRVATFEARQSALTVGIRGIVPLDANQPAREQGVGIYIDGVYLGRQHGLNAALFDVQRIEVLKGPQGTLFGRNTEGGALNIVTSRPTGEFGGRIVGGIGNFRQLQWRDPSQPARIPQFPLQGRWRHPAPGRDHPRSAAGLDRLELLRPSWRARRGRMAPGRPSLGRFRL